MGDEATYCRFCGQRDPVGAGHMCSGAPAAAPRGQRPLAWVAAGTVLLGAIGVGIVVTRQTVSNAASGSSSSASVAQSPPVTPSVEVTITVTPDPVVTPAPQAVVTIPPQSSPAAPLTRSIAVPAGTVTCSTDGAGIAATSMADNTWTSCVFADIVRGRYREAAPNGGAVWLPAVYTPKFNRYWDLQCEDTEPVHCFAPADGQVVVYLRRN